MRCSGVASFHSPVLHALASLSPLGLGHLEAAIRLDLFVSVTLRRRPFQWRALGGCESDSSNCTAKYAGWTDARLLREKEIGMADGFPVFSSKVLCDRLLRSC
mmetsp:Transcript_2845/g.6538  ORF Transcript_2845/g.6538 Transcript_2845/m.6538 type:complete len:103 (-) Transcript_2845:1649-1957(-)